MKTVLAVLFLLLCMPAQNFWESKPPLTDEKGFFEEMTRDELVFDKKLLTERYRFVQKLADENKYYDAVREIYEIRGDFSGASLQYLDYMEGRINLLLSDESTSNESLLFRYFVSNNAGVMQTNYYEYMLGEIFHLETGKELMVRDLTLVDRPAGARYAEAALACFDRILANRQRIGELRRKASLARCESLLLMNDSTNAKKEAQRFLDAYPADDLRIEALYIMSRICVQQKDLPRGIAWLMRLLREFPEGPHVEMVKLKIILLKEMKDSEGVKELMDVLAKWEEELKLRGEWNDYAGAILDRIKARQ